MKFIPSLALFWLLVSSLSLAREYDIVVYGGTSAAITAAIQADAMGRSVIVVSPDTHLGGLTSGGLGFTDSGDKSVIGGLSRAFYHRVWQHYQDPSAWTWQKRSEFGNRGQGHSAIDDATETMWVFEPSVAERIFEDWVASRGLEIVRDEWLDREKGVKLKNGRIQSITTLSGKTYRGRMFIDATYEGDLMAAAGVDYRVGREANSEYGEEHNGVQIGVLHHNHHFGMVPEPIDPYVIPGDPSSGVLPRISAEPPGEFGSADHRVQAYCFRTCYTNDPENRVPWPKPEGYDPSQYELLLRIFDAGWRGFFGKFDAIPNDKTDTNNHGPFSYDNIGYNYDYPEASYERRREIVDEHRRYQQGLIWFVANDPRVPMDVQERFNTWGLAADEFVDNGNWPHQLYVREARRMVGHHVMTENQLRQKEPTPDSVGMGSYTIDSHNVQRYITPEGHVQNEGDIGVHLKEPYTIAYGSLVPKRGQAENLLVPVACSATHIAYGSIRMEPVFMILGQSASTAASIAIERNLAVQDVPYPVLRDRLLADGQVLEAPPEPIFNKEELLGYWKLDGDFSDALGKRHGVFDAEGGEGPRFVDGPSGRALDLTEGVGFVELGLELGPDPKTLSFFARAPDFEPEQVWVGNAAPNAEGDFNHRFYLGSFTGQVFWGGGRNHRRGKEWPSADGERFYHYALVQRWGAEAAGTLEIYQDGQLLQSVFYRGTSGSEEGRPLRIGKGGGQMTHPSRAVIDDVAVFDRALSQSEIAAIARAGGVGALLKSAETNPPPRPNVVILLSDDLGYRDIGCYDGPARTPVLDRLADEGVRFTDFYSGAAVCSPSRATLLTGRHHIRAGVYSWIKNDRQASHLLEREATLAEVLKDAGYATAHVGKWHLGLPTPERPKPSPADHGFDHWFATENNAQPSHRNPANFIRNGEPVGRLEGYSAQIVVDEAIAWLHQPRPADQPFFLNVWFHEPHDPLAAPPEMSAAYGDPSDEGAVYSATVENTDRAMGRLLETLREIAPAKETLIIYSSDNGSYRPDRVGDLRGVKGANWEGGIRVPGIVIWPGTVSEGRVEDTPAGLVDVLPTVCSLLELPLPSRRHIDGADLSPLLLNAVEADFARGQPLFWHLQKSRPIAAVRDGNWSLVADPDYELSRDNMFEESWIPKIRNGGYTNFRLYDLETDPAQESDVSQQRPEVASRLKTALLSISASVMADGPDYGYGQASEDADRSSSGERKR